MEKLDKVKRHFNENKKVYAGVGVGLFVGAAITTLSVRNSSEIFQKVNQIAVGYKNNQVVVNFIERSTPQQAGTS